MNNNKKIINQFLNQGYVKVPALDKHALKKIKNIVIDKSKPHLDASKIKKNNLLEYFHSSIDVNFINDYRVKIIRDINNNKKLRDYYFKISDKYLELLVGNELAIQKNINLSIQIPNDKTSILPIHADTWSGNSPYEIVVWMPLVNCKKSQSMFIIDKKYYLSIQNNLKSGVYKNSNTFYNAVKNNLKWINIKYGELLIFDQTLPHGNIENIEKKTRWSLNCRFKSILSPYGTKKLGEYFTPINIKPITKIGLSYKNPFDK